MTNPDPKFVPASSLGNEVRRQKKLDRLRALAAWDIIPKSQRKKAGLAVTDAQFADQWGVNPNQIYKDRKTEEFERFRDAARENQMRQIDPRGTAAISETVREDLANDDLHVYQQLKGTLADEAMSGDSKSLELWMKLFGTPFIADEASRVDEVANLDDRALVGEIVDLVDSEMLLDVLREKGLI
jgi:hypothetical protein